MLDLLRSLQDLVVLFNGATAVNHQVQAVVDFLNLRTANQTFLHRFEYCRLITNQLIILGAITVPMQLSIGRQLLSGSSTEAPAMAPATRTRHRPMLENQQAQSLMPAQGYPTTGAMPASALTDYYTVTGSTRSVPEGWTIIPVTALIPETPRPNALVIGGLVRPFVVASVEVEDTYGSTTVQCKGDWSFVCSGFSGSCPSVRFRCKCGGNAKIPKILAVLTQGNWLLFSNNGVHHATEVPAGELLKLSSHYKSILMDLVVGDPSATPGTILKDFIESCRPDPYIDQLGYNLRHFERQVRNYVDNLRRRSVDDINRMVSLEATASFVGRHSLDEVLNSPSFVASDAHQSPREIQEALHLPSPSSYFTVPIIDEDFQLPAGSRFSFSPVDKVRLRGSLVLLCSGHLFTMLEFIKHPLLTNMHWAHTDDSCNFIDAEKKLYSVGCSDLDLHGGDSITREYRPFAHFVTECTSFGSPCVFLRALCRLVIAVFERILEIDGFITDYDKALRNGCMVAFPGKTILNCYPHIFGKIDGAWRCKFLPVNRNYVKKCIRMLHSCVTLPQFRTQFNLVVAEWGRRGDEEFAVFFQKGYGVDSLCGGLWFVFASGVVFIYGNNNSLEKYWHDLKGNLKQLVPPVFNLVVGIDQFLMHEIQKLMQFDLDYRCGVNIGKNLQSRCFLPLGSVTLGIVALMSVENDTHFVSDDETLRLR
jgi:hypothetical protein